MPQKYRAPFGRRIAHRSYQARRRGGRRRTVIVEIGTPAAVPGSDWGCRVRVRGLSEPIDQTIFGVDSLQALELGLMYSGAALSSSAEFRAGKLELWGKPATNLSDLVLPLGLHSLQSAIEALTRLFERLKTGKQFDKAIQRGFLTQLRNAAKDLALLAR